MSEKQIRTGIMGGAFDPIHYGHLLIAENAAAQYQLDKVIFIPSGHSPHKTKQHMTDAAHRCEMIRLAIWDNPCFDLSLFEIHSAGINYTYRTLEGLREQYPQDLFFFIMGGDSLQDFGHWKYPKRILDASCILAAVRDDVDGSNFERQKDELNAWYGTERIFRLNTPNFSVSSQHIRERAGSGRTIRYMLPEPVRDYIMEHQLYDNGAAATRHVPDRNIRNQSYETN